MKTCFFCTRPIAKGAKIIKDGIKYACVDEDDVRICRDIRRQNAEKKLQSEEYKQEQAFLQRNGAAQVECFCGLVFYTLFAVDKCPRCGATYWANE